MDNYSSSMDNYIIYGEVMTCECGATYYASDYPCHYRCEECGELQECDTANDRNDLLCNNCTDLLDN